MIATLFTDKIIRSFAQLAKVLIALKDSVIYKEKRLST